MVSVSMLSAYKYCRRKLFLEYVLGIREPLKEPVVLGSIRHECYEKINKTDEEIVRNILEMKTLDEIYEIYKAKYSKILMEVIVKNSNKIKLVKLDSYVIFKKTLPFLLEEGCIRAENIHSFIQENNVFGEELWSRLTPKIKSEYRIDSEKLNLIGIIDQLEIHGNMLVPVEMKTGKCPSEGVWPGHSIQIAAYALLLEDKFGIELKGGFLRYLDAKEKRYVAINPFLRLEVKETLEKVKALLESKEIPDFEENKNKCARCGLKQRCYDEEELKKLLESQ